MKKLFLGTTVLAAGLIASTAMAETDPRITISGTSDAQAAFADDSLSFDKDVMFRNSNEIKFSIDGDYNGIGYGAVIELEADVGDEQAGSPNADRTYVYLEGNNWGRLEFGSNDAASDTLKVDGASVARGTGGIDGDFIYFLTDWNNTPGDPGISGNIAVFLPHLPMGNLDGSEEGNEANKITYYSPKFGGQNPDEGLQIGVSFTPQRGDIGQQVTGVSDFENIFSAGIKYDVTFEDVYFAISGNMDMGDNVAGGDDMEAWQAGAMVRWNGFELAGSYANLGDFGGTEPIYYTGGVAYANEMFGASVTYLMSEEDTPVFDYEFENVVLSAEYYLAPGITPYAEAMVIEDESSKNDGPIFLVGTELAF